MSKMDIFEKSLLLLDEYFSETSPSMVEESLHIVDKMHVGGPTVSEYFSDFETEFVYKEWLQLPETPSFLNFNDNRRITQLDFNIEIDNQQYDKTRFFSELQDEFFATDSRKIAA